MNRLRQNQLLLDLLQKLVLDNPEQRFGQILQNYGFIRPLRPASPLIRADWLNEFYTEPADVLTRVRQRITDAKI